MTSSALGPDPSSLPSQPHTNQRLRSDHVVYFYQESASLLEGLSDFIGTTLGAGNAAIVVATKVHCDGLQRRLKDRGLDLQRASKQGRYVTLDAPQILSKLMVAGMPDGERFAEIIGGTVARTKALVKS